MQQSPGPAMLVTSRPVQNVHTGIDLSVPEYQEIRGKMMSGHVEYNIVVVTQLAAFKSAKHKAEDVIQFMVSKKYSEIDEFYQHLLARYSHISLPPLPRKVLFVGESDIRERRIAFNEIMRAISRNEELATSPDLLEFLGTRASNFIDKKGKNLPDKEDEDEDFFKEEKPLDVISQFKSLKEQVIKVTEKEEEEEEETDPLGVMKSKKTKKPTPPPVTEDKPKSTIFDEEIDPDEGLFDSAKDFSLSNNKRLLAAGENLKLFEDPDLGGVVTLGDSLLLPTACETTKNALSSSFEEDTEELLRVEDDFEKMLKLTSKPKPKVPPKPMFSKNQPEKNRKFPLPSAQTAKTTEVKIQAMDEVDILRYIKDNESTSCEEPSLF